MIAFILAGLVLGGIYAISAASIVVTYVSAGVLNFAFGAIAFFIARLYYYLVAQLGWPVYASAIVAIAITGPLLGVALYFALFRFLGPGPGDHQGGRDHRALGGDPGRDRAHLRRTRPS